MLKAKNREGCWKCLKTPSTTEWISCSVSMSICVFLLHLSFSEECEKCWEENEREREIDRTLSLFSQSNRFVYLETTACLPESSFPRASSPWISFLLSDSLVVLHRILISIHSTCVHSFRSRSRSTRLMAQTQRVQLRSSILICSDISFYAKKWE